MSIPATMLRTIVTQAKGSSVAKADARRALEIACLAVASDGRLADEELAALHVLSAELGVLSASELDALVGASLDLGSREQRLEQLRAVASGLSTEVARHLAYQLSVVTSLADLASADEEFEFDLDVQDALELDPQVAERLTADVNEALLAGGETHTTPASEGRSGD